MTQSTRVTVLVENTAFGAHVRGEHGLSFWIEAGPTRVLFDTGQTPEVLFHNAEWLGIDLETTDAIVLSHGHYDHTGGLEKVLNRTRAPRLFLHPRALARRYSRKNDGTVQEIGIPSALDRGFLRAHSSSLVWTDRSARVADELWVTGPVSRTTGYEDTGGDFFLDERCGTPDLIDDDQAVFFDTAQGSVVLLGCAHAGVVNTLHHVQELTEGRPIHAVIGGMHLVTAPQDRMGRTVEALRELDVGIIAPGHCTGARAQSRLGSEFPSRWEPCHVGAQFQFGG